MSRSIWKFSFETEDVVEVKMPMNAEILCLQTQRETPCIWAEVDTNAPKELRMFYIFGTGHPLPNNPGTYIGTYQEFGGKVVWHMYEKQIKK